MMIPTIQQAAEAFLSNVGKSRSRLTLQTYQNALLGGRNGFLARLKEIKPEDPVSRLNEKHAMQYMQDILDLAPATRAVHVAALRRFYLFIYGNEWADVSLQRLNFLLEGSNVLSRVSRNIEFDKKRLVQLIEFVLNWNPVSSRKTTQLNKIIALRNRAFMLTLAQSGLRVHEACKLKIKDLNLEDGSGIIVGKRDKQARFKIGNKAVEAIRVYLSERDALAKVEKSQPVFSSHSRRTGKFHVQHMTTQTGEDIFHRVEIMAFGEKSKMACHALRHMFVTRVLERTNNLKVAQELARHTNIDITGRYAHLLDSETDRHFDRAINS